jgi:hypothetical protein
VSATISIKSPQDAHHRLGIFADNSANFAIRRALAAHGLHLTQRSPLSSVGHQPAANHVPAERPLAAHVTALGKHVTLGVPDPLTDAIALTFSNRGKDGENHLANAVAGHVATEVNQVQAYALIFQFLKHRQCVSSGPKCTIELGRNNHGALLDGRKQPLSFRTLGKRHTASDAALEKTQRPAIPSSWRSR